MDIAAAAALQKFSGTGLTGALARIEGELKGATQAASLAALSSSGDEKQALAAAASLKLVAGQVNTAIHALGIMLCLPHILEEGEIVEYVSLGASNTGRPFDLETNRRVAEFKFIHWQGTAETIRQNSAFKDFFCWQTIPPQALGSEAFGEHSCTKGNGNAVKNGRQASILFAPVKPHPESGSVERLKAVAALVYGKL